MVTIRLFMMFNPFYFFVFIFGTIVGSFLNVVIGRYNTGRSIFVGRSMCFVCGRTLRWFELIPIVSFFWQKGRCRRCSSKISWQYPLIELVTGFVFVAIAYRQGLTLPILFYWLVWSILLVIAVYDYRHQIIPDGLVYGFIALALGRWFWLGLDWSALIAGASLLAFFALLWAVSGGRWLGFGDAKLALGIGWLLGWPLGVSAVVLGFWLGAAAGVFLLLRRKYLTMKSELPFAPFLILGAWLAFWLKLNVIFL